MLNSKLFDHTILKPETSKEDVKRICDEAIKNNFASVCVNQYRTKEVANLLKGTGVLTCTVVGFPLGAVSTDVKVYETKMAILDGADEIDMVINVGAMKDGNYEYVLNDIARVKEACGDKTLKVILETCLLDEAEKVKACELSLEAKADFVKTSTGFSKGGATAEDVALMRKVVGNNAGVKASGGIRDIEKAIVMVEAGASRLGTSKNLFDDSQED